MGRIIAEDWAIAAEIKAKVAELESDLDFGARASRNDQAEELQPGVQTTDETGGSVMKP